MTKTFLKKKRKYLNALKRAIQHMEMTSRCWDVSGVCRTATILQGYPLWASWAYIDYDAHERNWRARIDPEGSIGGMDSALKDMEDCFRSTFKIWSEGMLKLTAYLAIGFLPRPTEAEYREFNASLLQAKCEALNIRQAACGSDGFDTAMIEKEVIKRLK